MGKQRSHPSFSSPLPPSLPPLNKLFPLPPPPFSSKASFIIAHLESKRRCLLSHIHGGEGKKEEKLKEEKIISWEGSMHRRSFFKKILFWGVWGGRGDKCAPPLARQTQKKKLISNSAHCVGNDYLYTFIHIPISLSLFSGEGEMPCSPLGRRCGLIQSWAAKDHAWPNTYGRT